MLSSLDQDNGDGLGLSVAILSSDRCLWTSFLTDIHLITKDIDKIMERNRLLGLMSSVKTCIDSTCLKIRCRNTLQVHEYIFYPLRR